MNLRDILTIISGIMVMITLSPLEQSALSSMPLAAVLGKLGINRCFNINRCFYDDDN